MVTSFIIILASLQTGWDDGFWPLDFVEHHQTAEESGKEVQFYSIELLNGNIAGIRTEMLNNKYPENMKHEVREHSSFMYGFLASMVSPRDAASGLPTGKRQHKPLSISR
ncbi:MAG: hypothetical protein ACR2NP_19705 [Pirellulaceae bacterium]